MAMQKPNLREARKLRRRQENRKFILRAAEKVFAKEGYAQASVDDIAAEAQFSKATLYRYFKSKSDIFSAVIQSTFQEAHEDFLRIIEQDEDAEGKLREFIQIMLSFYKRKEHIARIFFLEQPAMKKALHVNVHDSILSPNGKIRLPADYRRIIEGIYDVLCRIIQEGVDSGEFRDMDPREACYFMGALLRGFHFRGHILEKEFTIQEGADLLLRFILHGFKGSRRL